MPRRKPVILEPVITYPLDAVVDPSHIAAAFRCGVEKVAELDLPCFWIGTRQKFVWRQVLEDVAERAKSTTQPTERAHTRRRKAG